MWMLRAVLLFTTSLLLVGGALETALAQHPQLDAGTVVEHRFTALETTVSMIAIDVKELKDRAQYEWLKALGLAGLVGEAGMRTMKRTRTKDERNP